MSQVKRCSPARDDSRCWGAGQYSGNPQSAAAGFLWHTRSYDVGDRKSTRLNSSHVAISYAVFCLKKKMAINVATSPLAAGMLVLATNLGLAIASSPVY